MKSEIKVIELKRRRSKMKKSEMKVLYEVKTLKNFMRIFEYHDHKFKIKIRHRNGTPLGFNDNCCLMIMTPDGTFKDVVDSRMLECGYMNRYVLDEVISNLMKSKVISL